MQKFKTFSELSLKFTKVLVKPPRVLKSKVLSSQNIENFNKIRKDIPVKLKDIKLKTPTTKTMGSHMGPILGMDRHMVNIQTLKITHIMDHISNMDAKT